MANYVCANLVGNVCTQWVEATQSSSLIEHLAITPQQADEIIYALLLVFISALTTRYVMNIILQRRY